jgi:hypothetical protein
MDVIKENEVKSKYGDFTFEQLQSMRAEIEKIKNTLPKKGKCIICGKNHETRDQVLSCFVDRITVLEDELFCLEVV